LVAASFIFSHCAGGLDGYAPMRSGLDRNPGWSEELVDQLGAVAADQFRRTRSRVTAIGHSFPRDGYRRITRQLRAEGMVVNHKAVARLMRENGLLVRPLRKFVRTTDSDHDGPIFPNLARDFRPTGPNHLWVGDLTYIRIAAGFTWQ
jgi:transposase InsO family protein